MSKSTINLVGSLMTVAVDMHLKAGMRVVVVNGVILSIYSGDTAVPLATHTHEVKPKYKDKRTTHTTPGRSSFMRADGQPIKSLEPIINHIRDMFKKHSELTMAMIMQDMGITPNGGAYWRVTSAITWMKENNEIMQMGSRTRRTFKLLPTEASNA